MQAGAHRVSFSSTHTHRVSHICPAQGIFMRACTKIKSVYMYVNFFFVVVVVVAYTIKFVRLTDTSANVYVH